MSDKIVFLDSRVPDRDLLLAHLPADVECSLLEEGLDGIDQILTFMAGRSGIDSIHLISHGSPGAMWIGSTLLDSLNVGMYASQLATLGSTLKENGDLLLYGCDIGAGSEGDAFVRTLAELTGADVAASDDPTGSIGYGGDLLLEVRSGNIEAASLLLPETWGQTLGVPAEFLVNTVVSAAQSTPSIAVLADGSAVVTWASYGQDGSQNGIYAQRYDLYGKAIGGEFQVNTHTVNQQQAPVVTALAHGGFVVAWRSYLQDGSSYGVYAQRYDSAGLADGAEFRVNVTTDASQSSPAVASLADGGYLVAWQSDSQDGSSFGIYARRYASDGQAATGEFRVNTTTSGSQSEPSVAALGDGGAVIVWQSDGQDGDGLGIYAQKYAADGLAEGGEFRVNTHLAGAQSLPSVAPLADGGFVVVWQSDGQDGSYLGVYGQRFDEAGSAIGGEFLVNTTTAWSQGAPVVAALSTCGFVVSWNSSGQDGGGYGIFARNYDAEGHPAGGEYRLNAWTTGDQTLPVVATVSDGGFLAAWQSKGQDGDDWGIYAQRFDADGNVFFGRNHEPAGAISINGIAVKGSTLNVDASKVADADGLGVFSYQWYADAIAITGATGSAYTLSKTEVGKAISVSVSYTDGQGYQEHLSSAPTRPVTFSALSLQGHRTATGIDIGVLLNAGTTVDNMDLEFRYDDATVVSEGAVFDLSAWQFFEAEPSKGEIAISGYAADLQPLVSEASVLVATLKFTFPTAEPGFSVRVTDYSLLGNSSADPATVDCGVLPRISSPVLLHAVADQQLNEDSAFRYTIATDAFVDSDRDAGDELVYSATLADGKVLPAWLHFNSETCTFSGTPLNEHVGSLQVKVTATDKVGLSASDLFNLEVANTNDAPQIAHPVADAMIELGVPYLFTVPGDTFSDPDAGDRLTFTATLVDGAPLPSWLHFDSDSRSFSGTPINEDAGTLQIRLSAADLSGSTTTDMFALTLKHTNSLPVGEPVITGHAMQGEMLTVETGAISDPDGIGSFSYQWYADDEPIAGAEAKSYTLTSEELYRKISVSVTYIDGNDTTERLESQKSAYVKWPVSTVSGEVRFWKTADPLSNVMLEANSAIPETSASKAILLNTILKLEDGTRTVEVWARSTTQFESLRLDFVLPQGSVASWRDADDLPTGCSFVSDTPDTDEIVITGFGVSGLPTGRVKLGTLAISAPDDPSRFGLSLVGAEVGSDKVAGSDIISMTDSSDSGGQYRFEALNRTGYGVTATKAIDNLPPGVITASDALAALKLAVGLNPNSNAASVSIFQYLAADINHDGQIRASDALGILKMAVHLNSAAAPEWLFVPESAADAAVDRKAVDWSSTSLEMTVANDNPVFNLVGIVRGDVNGSWMPLVG